MANALRPGHLHRTLIGFLCLFGFSTTAVAQHSDLWGVNGERWDALGRLPDYSYAGYHSGEKEIPDVAVVTNILDYGAIPNDDRDDSTAIQAAIDATSQGTILFPAGSYRLEAPLVIDKSGIVLRGEGQQSGGTLLYVPQNATERNGGQRESGFGWGSSGFIVLFKGNSPRSSYDIVDDQVRGDRTIRLSDASDFSAGDPIHLKLTDDELYGSLFRHVHNERLNGWSEGTRDSWCGANGNWTFTVNSVNGNTVTLKEPLPFDIRSTWEPLVQQERVISEVGVENLRIRFRYEEASPHHTEPGFNGIRFERVRDSWIRNVSIENADNGITVGKTSSRNTLRNILIEGRRGHHGTTISGGSSYNMIDGIELRVNDPDDPWLHGFTIDHESQGNVVQRARGNKELKLDLHRDSPFENLYTEILSQASFASGGNKCAGPHTGARLTLWNANGTIEDIEEDLLKGVDSQVNVITMTDQADTSSSDGLWIENIADLKPANLHQAQLDRRLGRDTPEVTLSLAAQTVDETDGVITVKAALDQPSTRNVTFSVHTQDGTAIRGEDYFGFTESFSIAAGSTEIGIPVAILDDPQKESDEIFNLRLFEAEGAKFSDEGVGISIVDNDPNFLPSLSLEDGQVIEGDQYSIRLALSEPATGEVTVQLATRPDTASNGADYFGLYRTVVFAPGETSLSVPVEILDDTEREESEIFVQRLFDPVGAVLGVGTSSTTISDND